MHASQLANRQNNSNGALSFESTHGHQPMNSMDSHSSIHSFLCGISTWLFPYLECIPLSR